MKYSLIIVALLFAAASPPPNTERWVVSAQSELIIRGTTNLNDFTCRTDFYHVRDTLELLLANRDCPLIFSRNAMIIPVASFNCGNEMITKDFQQTLNAERYPNLSIRFVSIDEQVPVVTSQSVTGVVEITLAGSTRAYSILYTLAGNGNNSISLVGTQEVCFSDFKLNAPRKMMGLIKVQDDLEVEFRLHLLRM